MTEEIEGVPYRTPACDKHLSENESDQCPWCQLAVQRAWLREKTQRIENLQRAVTDPGWDEFMAILDNWLQHYPAQVFDGSSGDPGALFIVAVRKAHEDLLKAKG